jgi:hypothetical protein
MTKQKSQLVTQELATRVTFAERLGELQALNAQLHFEAALAARAEFEARLVQQVRARALEVLDAVTGG